MHELKTGDIVLVSGFKLSKKGIETSHQSLAKVVIVGKYDVFVEPFLKNDFDRTYNISITRCQKINLDIRNRYDETVKPKIGNLVVSYTSYMGKHEKKVGNLKEIIDKPGSSKIARITCSTQEMSVPYDSLIVLED